MEYVPEKAELDDSLPEEFRKVFEKFSFSETAASEVEGALNNCPTLYVVLLFWDLPGKRVCDCVNIHIQETDKKDEIAANAASNKKADSDSEEEEEDNQQKEKGISNKKKKVSLSVAYASTLEYHFHTQS